MTDLEQNVTEEKIETSVTPKLDFAQYVQQQLAEIKEEVKTRLVQISTRFPVSNDDLAYIKETLKTEFSHVLEDVTQTSKDVKKELSEISVKHKAHLTETFKRSKDQAVEAFSKINLSQVKEKSAESVD